MQCGWGAINNNNNDDDNNNQSLSLDVCFCLFGNCQLTLTALPLAKTIEEKLKNTWLLREGEMERERERESCRTKQIIKKNNVHETNVKTIPRPIPIMGDGMRVHFLVGP